jgi:hypothetical protein
MVDSKYLSLKCNKISGKVDQIFEILEVLN